MKPIEEKLIDIEMSLTEQERVLSDLSDECVRMNKMIDLLTKQVKMLSDHLKESPVKPLSEETPPPHY